MLYIKPVADFGRGEQGMEVVRLDRIGFVVAGLAVAGIGFPVTKGSAQSVPVDPYVAAVDADGPLSHWRMGEATVSEPVVDRVSSQNGAATTTSRLSVGAWPGSGGATLFSGSGGVATTRLQTSVSAFSVEAWVKLDPGSVPVPPNGTASIHIVNSRGAAFAYGRGLSLEAVNRGGTGRVWFGMHGDYLRFGRFGDTKVDDGKWHHVVGTWSAPVGQGVAPNQFSVYVDGRLNSGTDEFYCETDCTTNSPMTGGGVFRFGTMGGTGIGANGTNSFIGGLDEVAMYNKALTPARVLAHYRAAVPADPGVIGTFVGKIKRLPLVTGSTDRKYTVSLDGAGLVSTVPVTFKILTGQQPPVALTDSAADTFDIGSGVRSVRPPGTTAAWEFVLTNPRGRFRAQLFVDANRDGVADDVSKVKELVIQ